MLEKYQPLTNKLQKIIAELVNKLGYEASIQVDAVAVDDKFYINVNITGEELRRFIGNQGKQLEQLKTVIQLIVRKLCQEHELEYTPVILDINGYMQERYNYVRELASTAAEQVLSTQQEHELLPMKPDERRIVHMTLQEHGMVTTESIGDGEERRVVIKLKN